MSVMDYKTKLTAIQSALSTANATGASYELFNNMQKPIQAIIQANPNKLATSGHELPAITIEVDSANHTPSEFRSTATRGREAIIDIIVTGMVWEDSRYDNDEDLADRECHYLAENIEEVLRADVTVSNNFASLIPSETQFYDVLDEEAHFRACVITFQGKIFY